MADHAVLPPLYGPDGAPLPWLQTLDAGIRRAVRLLDEAGVETFESCEGGPGHSFAEPTVRFHGTPAAGWKALAVCFDNGLPVLVLRRYWDIYDGFEPHGAHWEVVFKSPTPESQKEKNQ